MRLDTPSATLPSAEGTGTAPAGAGRDIFIVCNSVHELGGISSWLHRMADVFTARGHRVQAVGITPPHVPDGRTPVADYRLETLYPEMITGPWQPRGVADRLDLRARRRESRRLEQREAAVARLGELFAQARPGAVVIVTQIWAMEWVAEADTSGVRVIGMSHESFAASAASSRGQRVMRYYADADWVLALTQKDADAWAKQGLHQVSAMPNALPLTPQSAAPRTAKAVVALGRLSHEKGYDQLLDAWALAAPQAGGWTLRIFGDGVEAAPLRQQCAELGIAGSVDFAGRTGDVSAALRGGSVLAQPSRAEGFPLTLLEAMANGVPCVAFDCAPGVREIIEDGVDGLVVRPGDVDAFARALLSLVHDRDLRDRLGDRAFRSVRRYAPEAIAERWERLFDFLDR